MQVSTVSSHDEAFASLALCPDLIAPQRTSTPVIWGSFSLLGGTEQHREPAAVSLSFIFDQGMDAKGLGSNPLTCKCVGVVCSS